MQVFGHPSKERYTPLKFANVSHNIPAFQRSLQTLALRVCGSLVGYPISVHSQGCSFPHTWQCLYRLLSTCLSPSDNWVHASLRSAGWQKGDNRLFFRPQGERSEPFVYLYRMLGIYHHLSMIEYMPPSGRLGGKRVRIGRSFAHRASAASPLCTCTEC